jgi:hypothetical protein
MSTLSQPHSEPTPPLDVVRAFNWHPVVHVREFHEQLYFYLIRLDGALHKPVAEQIRETLALASVEYACEYSIFGHWDALIRVWLSQASRRTLDRVLDTKAANVAEARYFRADEVRHLWVGHEDNLLSEAETNRIVQSIGIHDDRIRALAGNPGPVQRDDPLLTSGLIIERPSTSSDSVKFYISLEGPHAMSRNLETKAILAALNQSGLAQDASLYSGSGTFAQYLVRGVSPVYKEVLEKTAQFDILLADTHLRPMTLLVANTNARESDNANDVEALNDDDELSAMQLKLPDAAHGCLKSLPKDDRRALHRLIHDAFQLSALASGEDEDLLTKLRQLLSASVVNDAEAVLASVSFLIESEWLAGAYLKRTWAHILDTDWMVILDKKFAKAAGESSTEKERGYYEVLSSAVRRPKEWTLGTIVNLAIASARLDLKIAGRISKDLGEDWKREIHTLHEMRNFIAHGHTREVVRFDDFDGEWGEKLRDLTRAARLHYRFEQTIGKTNGAIS